MFHVSVKRCSSFVLIVFLPIELMIMSTFINSYSVIFSERKISSILISSILTPLCLEPTIETKETKYQTE